MFLSIGVILGILWGLGMVYGYRMGGAIYIVLAAAIIMMCFGLHRCSDIRDSKESQQHLHSGSVIQSPLTKKIRQTYHDLRDHLICNIVRIPHRDLLLLVE